MTYRPLNGNRAGPLCWENGRRFASLASLAVLCVCATTGQRDPEQSERQFYLAEDYFRKGMDEPALAETMKALQLDPKNAQAHHLLGLIFFRQGVSAVDMAERDQCLEKRALADQKKEADEKMEQAREEFRKAAELQENFSEAHSNLAAVALHFKQYDEAIAEGRKALSNILYRQPHLAHGNIGWAYYLKGDLYKAERELRQAIFHQPEFCVGRYRLAKVHFDKKEIDKAIDQLDKVLADPRCSMPEAAHLAGMSKALSKDTAGAKVLFQKCVDFAPRSCEALACQRDARLLD